MPLFPSPLRVLITPLVCAIALLSCAHVAENPRWHEVSGASFGLRSCGDEKDTLALAADLQEVRATLSNLLPAIPARDDVPFRIHVFCRSDDYTRLAPLPAQSNHFVLAIRRDRVDATYETQKVATVSRAGGTQMAVRGGQLRAARDLVRHHYVHHLVRTHTEVPLWIEEGLAGFVGTTLRVSGGVRRGRASSGMQEIEDLGPQVRVGRSFRATDLATWPLDERIWFYHSTWLVMHYLHFGGISADGPPGPKLRRFAELHAGGADEIESSESAFGKSTVALRNAIDRHRSTRPLLVRNGRVEDAAGSSSGAGLAIRPIPDSDAAYELGVLALGNGDAVEALRHFGRVSSSDASQGPAQAGRARALALRGDWQAAVEALARADAVDPEGEAVLLNGAWVYFARANSPEAETGDLDRARGRAERLLSQQPLSAEAHFLVAQTLVRPGDGDARMAALERAHAASPGAIEIALDLAEAFAEQGRIDEARALGTRVGGWVLGELQYVDVQRFLEGLPRSEAVASGA